MNDVKASIVDLDCFDWPEFFVASWRKAPLESCRLETDRLVGIVGQEPEEAVGIVGERCGETFPALNHVYPSI